MSISISIETTPNPNALKFILDRPVLLDGKLNVTTRDQAKNVPLIAEIFALEGITQAHLFDNVITVTKSEASNWSSIESEIKSTLYRLMPKHNPDIPVTSADKDYTGSAMGKIEEILDRTIRPHLQNDGGDLQLIGLDQNVLTIHYEGACGSCPSAIYGTLQAIQHILREQFNPDIQVVTDATITPHHHY